MKKKKILVLAGSVLTLIAGSVLTLPNHIWHNTLSGNIIKLVFHKIKRDGITSLHGIHDLHLNAFVQISIHLHLHLHLIPNI